MPEHVIKYNPGFLSDTEIIKAFVVRCADFDLVMQTIRENTTSVNQHVLLIGPRGAGKTMLVQRVAAELKRDPKLKTQWYPIVFAEESYQVTTPGEFWLEAMLHLGEQTGEPRWQINHQEFSAQWQDEDTMRERALGQLLTFADAQGKRLLLIVENLNMLLGDQISDDDAWKLRHTLQNEPRLMLLGTATSRFDEIDQANKAMYELFRVHHLQPLDADACRIFWQSLTGQQLEGDRVRPIQILTGGNLRLLTILSTFGAHLSLRQLMADLVHLVDDHTEYFKSHLDALPPVERKIYLSLAELWDPCTARDVAKAARMDVNKASSLLRRLVTRGAAMILDESARTKWYQVTERMYNIYYLFRRRGPAAQRVRAVVHFMISFYEPEQLLSVVRRIADEVPGLDSIQRQDHYHVFSALVHLAPEDVLRHKLVEVARHKWAKLDDIPDELARLMQPPSSISADDKQPNILEHQETEVRQAINDARRYTERSRFAEAEAAYRKALDLAPQSAWVWGMLGILLHENLSRFDEAEAAYRKVLDINPEHAWAWALLGMLLHVNLSRFDEAEAAYRKALDLDPQYAWAWARLGMLLHVNLSRFDEAEAAYRKALDLDPQYAWAWAQLVRLFLDRDPSHKRARKYAERAIAQAPDNPYLMSALAWEIYEVKEWSMLERALEWALKAVELAPNDGNNHHTLASIQCALGKTDDALKSASRYLMDKQAVRDDVDAAIRLFVELAANGVARKALDILLNAPTSEELEPLGVGLRMFLGEDVKVAAEIKEIGRDVAQRMHRRRKELQHEALKRHDSETLTRPG